MYSDKSTSGPFVFYSPESREENVCVGVTKEVRTMCDYSLENVASRPATIADKLVTTKFDGSITLGFASVTDHNPACCLRPGTELASNASPRQSRRFLFGSEAASGRVARFRQESATVP